MKKHFLLLWLLLCCSIGIATAQSRTVQGHVKSADGEALPGVTVQVKGTTVGATTGPEGNYILTLPTGTTNPTLIFSFIGFTSNEVAVGDRATLDVTLNSDSQQLSDVVVIGFQEVQRRDVTGAVSSVNAQQIKDIPVNSAAEALAGPSGRGAGDGLRRPARRRHPHPGAWRGLHHAGQLAAVRSGRGAGGKCPVGALAPGHCLGRRAEGCLGHGHLRRPRC